MSPNTRETNLIRPSPSAVDIKIDAVHVFGAASDTRKAVASATSIGVPLGKVARRLGHSVETLVSTYVGAMDADEELGNTRIDSILDEHGSTTDNRVGRFERSSTLGSSAAKPSRAL